MINYDELLAPAAKSMRPSGIRKFFDLAADMPHCISLGVGEPDFKTPWSVRDAGIRSLELGRTKYTANAGLKELRSEICNYLARRFELHYKEENVLVTVGGSEAIDLTIRALVQPGDEVVIPEPCFVCYEPITQLTGGVPVHIATRAEDQFRLTADQLRAAITPKTKLLIFPYPNNPTGAVMSTAEMEEIAAVLRETNVVVLSDEIYSELTYGLDRHVSIASPLIKVMTKIHQSCIMSAPTTSQYAAITALHQCDDQIEMMRDEYNRRRRYVVKSLNDMGLTCFEPRGAFYVFPSIQISGLTSSEFCEQLLREKEVAIIPGSAFGASGEGYARISYAYSVDHLQTAMKRIREFLHEHGWEK